MVLFDPIPPGNTGGSNIISYELQMDDGKGGDFISLKGFTTDNLETSFLIDKGITKGVFY